MKTLCCSLFALVLFIHLLPAQNRTAEEVLIALKEAVNEKDLSRVASHLADDYRYGETQRPMSVNILQQVIVQFPKIDSILIKNQQRSGNNIVLNTRIYAVNGTSDKTIILNSGYQIVQADIAAIAMQGHGGKPASPENTPVTGSGNIGIATLPFSISETGHMVVEAELNGVKGNFIVDNGTSGSLMLNSRFSTLEMEASTDAPLGVSGYIKEPGTVLVNRFRWEHLEFDSISAMAADLDHLGKNLNIPNFAGTIGYGILKAFIIEFDYQHQQLLLWPNATSLKTRYEIEPEQIVPLTMAFHIPVLQARIGNRKVRLGIDCGAQGNMLEKKWEEVLQAQFDQVRTETLGGAENNYVEVTKANVKNVTIRDNTFAFDFVFANLFGGAHKVDMLDGIIGYPFLSRQRTAINFRDNELYFLE